jgi:hypothetical protein
MLIRSCMPEASWVLFRSTNDLRRPRNFCFESSGLELGALQVREVHVNIPPRGLVAHACLDVARLDLARHLELDVLEDGTPDTDPIPLQRKAGQAARLGAVVRPLHVLLERRFDSETKTVSALPRQQIVVLLLCTLVLLRARGGLFLAADFRHNRHTDAVRDRFRCESGGKHHRQKPRQHGASTAAAKARGEMSGLNAAA